MPNFAHMARDCPVFMDSRYITKAQDCVLEWSLSLGIPVFTTVANATRVRWKCGAEVLILDDEVHYSSYPQYLAGWINITRVLDNVEIASA